jgi:cytochrome c55X
MLLAALALACSAAAAADAESPAPGRRNELTRMVRQDCGSCHGMTLKGGLGPALTSEALREKPAEMLVAAILSGRAGTAMPPWRNFVSETEAAWIVEQLQKEFPRER